MNEKLFYCGISLLSACSWALGAILWRKLGEQLSSFSMNLGKSVIGSIYLGVFLLFIGFQPVDMRSVVFLLLSGVIGIAVGDTFFFMALMELGPRRASLLGALTPVAIAVAAAVSLGERPTPGTWAGIAATTVGVGWVLWERASAVASGTKSTSMGICYGLLSVLCTAGAVLLAKVGVTSMPTLHATWFRLLAGSSGLALWGISRSELGCWAAPFRKKEVLAKVAAVVALVVAGGFWLSLLALKHIDAAIAGPLNATGPLFMLPMSVIFMKEKLSGRAMLGTVIAVAGVALILKG